MEKSERNRVVVYIKEIACMLPSSTQNVRRDDCENAVNLRSIRSYQEHDISDDVMVLSDNLRNMMCMLLFQKLEGSFTNGIKLDYLFYNPLYTSIGVPPLTRV